MVYIAIIVGCVIGALIGNFAPIISYTYSEYLAIAIVAALDTIFGGVVASIKKNYGSIYFWFFRKCYIINIINIFRCKIKC